MQGTTNTPELRDVFGGSLDPKLQPDERDHYWVAIGTDVQHCMRCMMGWGHEADTCPRRPPVGHPGGPIGRDAVSDSEIRGIVDGRISFEDLGAAKRCAVALEIEHARRDLGWMAPLVHEAMKHRQEQRELARSWVRRARHALCALRELLPRWGARDE